MTFIAPTPSAGAIAIPFAVFRRAPKVRDLRLADEDGARKAMGADTLMPAAPRPGPSLEDLARVALG